MISPNTTISVDGKAEDEQVIQAEIALSTKAELRQTRAELAQTQHALQMMNHECTQLSEECQFLTQQLWDKQNDAAGRQASRDGEAPQVGTWSSTMVQQLYQQIREARQCATYLRDQARILTALCRESRS